MNRLSPIEKTVLSSSDGALTVEPESNGALPVNIQDQTSPPVDLFFTQPIGIPTALTSNIAIDDTAFEVDSVANINVGNYLGLFSGTSAEARFFFAEVLTVGIATATTVTVDTPLDFAFSSGDPVISTTREMDVNGAITPQVFSIVNGSVSSTIEVDITRIMISMVLSSAADDGLFGNIASLTNGITFRRVDGDTRNVFNAKDNGELANLAYDVNYTTRSGGLGSWGMRCRYTFAGQDKHGVALRLMPGDALEITIQDDLTGLNRFRTIAAGHIVTD